MHRQEGITFNSVRIVDRARGRVFRPARMGDARSQILKLYGCWHDLSNDLGNGISRRLKNRATAPVCQHVVLPTICDQPARRAAVDSTRAETNQGIVWASEGCVVLDVEPPLRTLAAAVASPGEERGLSEILVETGNNAGPAMAPCCRS